jgi:hypothetical protein
VRTSGKTCDGSCISLLFGVCTIFFVGALLQITAAGTLFGSAPPRDVSDLVRLFSPIPGTAGQDSRDTRTMN